MFIINQVIILVVIQLINVDIMDILFIVEFVTKITLDDQKDFGVW